MQSLKPYKLANARFLNLLLIKLLSYNYTRLQKVYNALSITAISKKGFLVREEQLI